MKVTPVPWPSPNSRGRETVGSSLQSQFKRGRKRNWDGVGTNNYLDGLTLDLKWGPRMSPFPKRNSFKGQHPDPFSVSLLQIGSGCWPRNKKGLEACLSSSTLLSSNPFPRTIPFNPVPRVGVRQRPTGQQDKGIGNTLDFHFFFLLGKSS